jgi:alginate O-acetyltransferase complex protein AlgI
MVYHGREQGRRKLWAAIGVIGNLALLLFFKYSNLLYLSLGGDLGKVDGIGELLISIPLPIGISFFTFQGISLMIDSYRLKESGKPGEFYSADFLRHWYNTTFFKAFFPQLIAGPIVKARQFLPQIGAKFYREIRFDAAFKALVMGYFLKMVVADNLKDQTFWIAVPFFQNLSSPNLILMLVGYSMQIFVDFAGYSLIAVGIAELFRFRLPQNFNYPYIARSFSEFWTRWHISLSSWLKEYL